MEYQAMTTAHRTNTLYLIQIVCLCVDLRQHTQMHTPMQPTPHT